MAEREHFQDHMPGNVCFGCGSDNPSGLHIHSYWQGDEAVCQWQPDDSHQGWQGVTCGGIIATLIDCHCMATTMATAIRQEGRALSTEPHYKFATGMLNIKYLKPTLNDRTLELRAHVIYLLMVKRQPRPMWLHFWSTVVTNQIRPIHNLAIQSKLN